jgi:uncharacterized membrane protein
VSGLRARRVPAFSVYAGLVLCLVGLAVSAYLTIEHFDSSVTLSCPDTGIVNCQKVTTSSYSAVLGIPVALLGLGFFVVAAVLMSPPAWRSPDPRLVRARLTLVSVGMLMVLYLVWAEFFGANAVCLWCSSVHAVTFLLFALVLFTEAWIPPPVPE